MKRIILLCLLFIIWDTAAFDATVERINGNKIILKTSKTETISIGEIFELLYKGKPSGKLTVLRVSFKKNLLLGKFKGDDFITSGDIVKLKRKKDMLQKFKSKRKSHFGFLHGIINATKNYTFAVEGQGSSGFGAGAMDGLGLGFGYDYFYRIKSNLPYIGLGASYEFSREVDFVFLGDSTGNARGGTYKDVVEEDANFSNINIFIKLLFPITDEFDFSVGTQLNFLTFDTENDPTYSGLGTHLELSTNFNKFRISLMYRAIDLTYDDAKNNTDDTILINEIMLKAGVYF